MIITSVGFCESLTFCAPNKVNTDGSIANACQELRFLGWGIFVTKLFDAESQCFVIYSSYYVVIYCFQHKTYLRIALFAYKSGPEY